MLVHIDNRAPSPDRRIQQGGMNRRWWGIWVELYGHLVDPACRLVKKRARDFRVFSALPRTRCQAKRSCSLCWGLTIKVSHSLSYLKDILFNIYSLKLQHKENFYLRRCATFISYRLFSNYTFVFIGIATQVKSHGLEKNVKCIF